MGIKGHSPARRLTERNCSSEPDTAVCFMNCVNVWSVGLYSFHPGACGVAMCDGSAQLLNDDINVTAFCRMLTYRGREPVPDTSQ